MTGITHHDGSYTPVETVSDDEYDEYEVRSGSGEGMMMDVKVTKQKQCFRNKTNMTMTHSFTQGEDKEESLPGLMESFISEPEEEEEQARGLEGLYTEENELNPATGQTGSTSTTEVEVEVDVKVAMALNDAYIALEEMRKANLELTFVSLTNHYNKQERIKHQKRSSLPTTMGLSMLSSGTGDSNTTSTVMNNMNIHEYCTACLHQELDRQTKAQAQAALEQSEAMQPNSNSSSRRHSYPAILATAGTRTSDWWHKFCLDRNKNPPTCLVCANPTCYKHACRKTRNQSNDGLHVCHECAKLFQPDTIMKQLVELREKSMQGTTDATTAYTQDMDLYVTKLMDAYDRALILLHYAAPYIDEIATCLETNTKNTTHIHLSSSSVGFLAGVTGVGAVAGQGAAAVGFTTTAALLTPAGPPLLLASLVLGGTAASATIGTEVYNHARKQSYTGQSANKILAWYQVVTAIGGVLKQLKEQQEGKVEGGDDESVEDVTPKDNDNIPSDKVGDFIPPTSDEYALSAIDDDDDDSVEDVTPPNDNTVITTANPINDEESLSNEYGLSAIDDDDDDTNENEKESAETTSSDDTDRYELSAIDDDDDDDMEEEPTTNIESPTTDTTSQPSISPTEEYALSAIDVDDVVDYYNNKDGTEGIQTADPSSDKHIGDSGLREPALDVSATNTSSTTETDPLILDPATTTAPTASDSPSTATTTTTTPPATTALLKRRKNNGKHPLACIMPLAPLLDDVFLNISKMFMDPTGGARVAISRASSHAFKVAQIATIACGALSAATIVLEANNFSKSLAHFKAGSPCQKAQLLRHIAQELQELPSTKAIAEQCDKYFVAMAVQRQQQGDHDEKEQQKSDEEERETVDRADLVETKSCGDDEARDETAVVIEV